VRPAPPSDERLTVRRGDMPGIGAITTRLALEFGPEH